MTFILNNTNKARRRFATIELRADLVRQLLVNLEMPAAIARDVSGSKTVDGYVVVFSSLKDLKARQSSMRAHSVKVVVSNLSPGRTNNVWLNAHSLDASSCLPKRKISLDRIDLSCLRKVVSSLPKISFPCEIFPHEQSVFSNTYLDRIRRKDLERKRRKPQRAKGKKTEIKFLDLKSALKEFESAKAHNPSFLRDLRWPGKSDLPLCVICGERDYITYRFKPGTRSEIHGYRCKRCPNAKQLGPLSGTYLHGLKMDVSEIFSIAHLFSKFHKELKGKHLVPIFHGHPHTYERVLSRLRIACAQHPISDAKTVMALALKNRPAGNK